MGSLFYKKEKIGFQPFCLEFVIWNLEFPRRGFVSYFEYTPLRVESGTHGKSALESRVITNWILGAVRIDSPLIGDVEKKEPGKLGRWEKDLPDGYHVSPAPGT
jgi:hypothetical protein